MDQPARLADELDSAAIGGGVPAAVAASLAEELAALPSQARRLLEAAAVAGEPFDPALAGEVGELEQAQALAALDDLLNLDLVRPTRGSAAFHLPPSTRAQDRL